MILLIDNYDSFTFNIYQQIKMLGKDVLVKAHDQITLSEIDKLKPEKIIISPGPRTPDGAGISLSVIEKYYKTIPILGVCLGHECIGQIFGAKIMHAKHVLHGKTSLISHTGSGIWKGIENPLIVARYHSLAISECPKDFTISAWAEDGEIMAISHDTYPLFGVQFHPESFMTKDGDKLMRNFLYEI